MNEAKNRRDRKRRNAQSGKQPARDAKYLAFVRRLLCFVCFQSSWQEIFGGFDVWRMGRAYNCYTDMDHRTQACHMGPPGIRQKASDYTAIPMCAKHHDLIGSLIKKLEALGIDYWSLVAKLWAAYESQRED